MTTLFSRKRTSSLALAIALATGSAVAYTAFSPAEASAQSNDDDTTQQANGGGYSDAFRAAYVPLDEALKVEGVNVAALKPQIDALIPLLVTNDEKIAGGGLIFNAGIAASDRVLQLRGMETMLESGLVPVAQQGRYNFIAYQLSTAREDFPKARRYLQGAIDNNFSTEQITKPDLQIAMAENFFAAGELDAGFDFLGTAIDTREAQGLEVEERWYRRGLTVAYENESVPAVYDFTTKWIRAFPSDANWRDAVNVTRNLNEFGDAIILDLFRLSRRVNALQDASDYDYYVEAADPRRLPREVKDVIDEGFASGVVSRDNLFITEALGIAESRIAADVRELPALERDANAADAGMRTVVAAGDAFLSYGEFAKAANFYQKALGMPGTDTGLANTRLGIALIEMGSYDDARQALSQVGGERLPIARLWIAFADEKEANAQAVAPVPQPAAPATAS